MRFLYVPSDADATGPGTALKDVLIWETGSHWKALGWRGRDRAPGEKDLFSGVRVSDIPCESGRTAEGLKDSGCTPPPLVLLGVSNGSVHSNRSSTQESFYLGRFCPQMT